MARQFTPEQVRRRRGAATELRDRARLLLEDAQMLDNYPAMHLNVADMDRIAQALGVSAEALYKAVETLYPGGDTSTEADHLPGTADTAERPE